MKFLNAANRFERQPRARKGEAALTLVETMITMGLFTMVVGAFVYTQLFGMKQDSVIQSKLGASDQSRRSFDLLARDVRSAKIYQVGNYSGSTFTAIANGTTQQGNAVQLCLTTNQATNIVYYFNTGAGELRRIHTGDATYTVIAKNLTNSPSFSAERVDGSVQTDLSHKGLIHTKLEFWQYHYPTTLVGPGCYYDYYKIDLKFCPHVPDGP